MRKIKLYIISVLRREIKKILSEIEAEKSVNQLKQFRLVASFEEPFKFEPYTIIANNRQDKSKIVIGKDSWIKGQLLIFKHGGEIVIGNHCFIGENSRIWSSKKIKIGDRVLISHNVNIHDNVSHSLSAKMRHEEYTFIYKNNTFLADLKINEKELIIEDDVWIGFNSTILKGVRIGRGAIIGAGSVITENIPPYSIVVGNPPRIIKQSEQ